MNLQDIARQRLYNQRLTGPKFASPEEAVRWFGAVQAQEYQPSLWAVGQRLANAASEDTVKRAILDHKIVRTWPMRGTIHYIPAEDAAWMLRLTARRVNQKFMWYLTKIGLTEDHLKASRTVLERILAGSKPLMRKEIYAELEAAGIPTSNSFALHTLGYWAQEGLICSGPHEGKQQTFVLLDEWVPHMRSLSDEEALAELAKRYFISHGPATVQDFAWWAGITVGEAKQGLAAVSPGFVHEKVDGKEYWFAPTAGELPAEPSAHLLPCFDEYTVAYKDRGAAVDAADLKAFGYGVNLNNIIIDGRIAGYWKREIKKDKAAIDLHPLREWSDQDRSAVHAAAERYAAYLGLPHRTEEFPYIPNQ